MSVFINTVDVVGDEALIDSIIARSITEIADNEVDKVGDDAFSYCEALTKVDFPVATNIGNGSFNNCVSLTTANFSAATNIGENAFEWCSNLTKVDFPAVTNIGFNAFYGCTKLTAADFPMVTSIDPYAFCFAGMTALILRKTDAICTLVDTSALMYTAIASGAGYIYVPAALIDSYKAATNWSTYAAQFRKLEDWTVDGTVTGELAIEGRHMVRFFDEDGTLLSYVIVPTGGNAVYDGDEPVKEGEWAFNGWKPEPTNVTADMDCYAQYKNNNIYTWPAVAVACADGTYKDVYKIGDTVPLDLGSEGVVDMQIVAFDTDNLADGTGKASITWVSLQTLRTACIWNPPTQGTSGAYIEGTGAVGGWEKSNLRNHLKETVKPIIPADAISAIKEVTKTHPSRNTKGSGETQTTTDDVWVPSYSELNQYTMETVKYTPDGVCVKWWTRQTGGSRVNVIAITTDGVYENASTTATYNVVLGFCT